MTFQGCLTWVGSSYLCQVKHGGMVLFSNTGYLKMTFRGGADMGWVLLSGEAQWNEVSGVLDMGGVVVILSGQTQWNGSVW